jgi:hypothetical protein
VKRRLRQLNKAPTTNPLGLVIMIICIHSSEHLGIMMVFTQYYRSELYSLLTPQNVCTCTACMYRRNTTPQTVRTLQYQHWPEYKIVRVKLLKMSVDSIYGSTSTYVHMYCGVSELKAVFSHYMSCIHICFRYECILSVPKGIFPLYSIEVQFFLTKVK